MLTNFRFRSCIYKMFTKFQSNTCLSNFIDITKHEPCGGEMFELFLQYVDTTIWYKIIQICKKKIPLSKRTYKTLLRHFKFMQVTLHFTKFARIWINSHFVNLSHKKVNRVLKIKIKMLLQIVFNILVTKNINTLRCTLVQHEIFSDSNCVHVQSMFTCVCQLMCDKLCAIFAVNFNLN